jgi:hypothetical protein
MNILFDDAAIKDDTVYKQVEAFVKEVNTLEIIKKFTTVIHQDGKSKGYYIKCGIPAEVVYPLLDLNAKLDSKDEDSFRANRELLVDHNTYKRMVSDAKAGREFNDIIVEYTKEYSSDKPLKIWGGQHRVKAIQEAYNDSKISRYHGFKIFFNLSKQQRTEIALISNTNIAVSNDLFDRLQEETLVGLKLRAWCYQVGLLKKGEDFPDQGSRSEKTTVKLARTFVTNFYKGKEKADELKDKDLDKNIYEPHLCESGVNLDSEYEKIINNYGDKIWYDQSLLKAGKSFATLHTAQYNAVKAGKGIVNRKGFRNKAMTESVISAWAYVAGLLQNSNQRLQYHYLIPQTGKAIPDPLNAKEMSTFRHDTDDPTYRGLGTRSAIKDRQRMAQLFLARSLEKDRVIDKSLMNKAVSQVVGIKSLQKGYTM